MRKTTFVIISIIIALLLAGLALGTGFILKTNNKDFARDPEFYRSLGDELFKQGQNSKAISAYEMSLTLSEDNEVINNLAVLYYKEGAYDKAITNLRKLIESDDNNPGYHYDLAVNLVDKFRNTEEQSIADLEKALTEYERANELSPGFSHSLENIDVLRRVLKK